MYIPQFGTGTASLNVSVACSIVLHRFTSWAKYKERPREGEKYQMASRPLRRNPRGVVPLTPSRPRETRTPSSYSLDGYQSDRSNSDSASGYLSGIFA